MRVSGLVAIPPLRRRDRAFEMVPVPYFSLDIQL